MIRTLVVRLDSAGDVLLAGPAVRAAAHGSSYTAMLCGPQGEQAARLLPGVDDVLVYDAPWVGLEPPPVRRGDHEALIEAVSAGRFDRALILASYHQSPLPIALLLRMAGVRWIAADSEHYPGSLLDLRHRRAAAQHEARAALALAEAAGFALPAGDDGALRVRDTADTTHLTGEDPYLVVHPGAAVPARAWSPERAARAVAALDAAGHRVVVTGGPGEKELTAAVAGEYGLDLGGRTDLRELAGVLSRARAVVTGNTGPSHLAAAVGAPVVCLFAPVVPAERWAPYGVPHVVLGRQDAPCAGTRARECPVPGHPCLDSVTDAELLSAVGRLTGTSTEGPARPAAASERAAAPRTAVVPERQAAPGRSAAPPPAAGSGPASRPAPYSDPASAVPCGGPAPAAPSRDPASAAPRGDPGAPPVSTILPDGAGPADPVAPPDPAAPPERAAPPRPTVPTACPAGPAAPATGDPEWRTA